MDRQPLFLEPVGLDLAFGDATENLRRIDAAVAERLAREPEAPSEQRLILFPELALTGFVTKDPKGRRLDPPDPDVARFQEIARRRRVALAAGLPEANPDDPQRPFNTLALFGPDGALLGTYRKMHLFTQGTTTEIGKYAPGDAGRVVVYRGWRIGLAVCFDIRFTGLFLEYAKAKVDLLLLASCWVDGPHKSYQYRTICSSHAILTQAYAAAVNRAGRDPFFAYDGSEYVFSPWGENLYKGRPVRLDYAEIEAYRKLPVRPSDRDDYRISD